MQYLRMPIVTACVCVCVSCGAAETPVLVCNSAVMGTAKGFDTLRRHDSSDSMDVNLF